jgi:hypothetical protein
MAPISLVILRVFIVGKIVNAYEMDSVLQGRESGEMTRAQMALHFIKHRIDLTSKSDLQRPTPNLLLNLLKRIYIHPEQ